MKKTTIFHFVLFLIVALLVSCGGPSNSQASSGQNALSDPSSPEAIAAAEASKKAAQIAAAQQAEKNLDATLSPEARQKLMAKPVAPPSISPASGVSKTGVTVTINCPTKDAKVIYTTDGSPPVIGTSPFYAGPLNIQSSTIVRSLSYIPGGRKSPVIASDYTIDEIWVSPKGLGKGTRSQPLGSIAKAVESARLQGLKTVKLTLGTFQESLTIQEPVSISGGWQSDFKQSTREFTTVVGIAMPGDGKKSPAYALKVATPNTEASIFERIEWKSGDALYSAGLFASENAKPVFRNCRFIGGQGSYSYGSLLVSGAAPSFELCYFDGGPGDSTIGLSLDSASAQLLSCVTKAGTGRITGIGATLTDGKIQASSSVFAGGTANTNYGISLYNSKDTKLEACTLWGGSGRDATALFISVGNPQVTTSILASAGTKTSYGIYSNYGESRPKLLRQNIFSGCATALYFETDTRTAYSNLDADGNFITAAGKKLPNIQAAQSAKSDLVLTAPLFMTPANAPDSVIKKGADLNGGVDAAGHPRTSPWSIGAYEIDR